MLKQNQMAFLACGGNNSDTSKSVEQLENLLRSTTTQNKVGKSKAMFVRLPFK